MKTQERVRREQEVELRLLEGIRRRLGDDVDVLKALGDLYTRLGRWEEGLALDLELVRQRPEDPLVWYNLGCSLALLKRGDEAVAALQRAVRLGYDDFEWMGKDADLASLRHDERFQSLLSGADR